MGVPRSERLYVALCGLRKESISFSIINNITSIDMDSENRVKDQLISTHFENVTTLRSKIGMQLPKAHTFQKIRSKMIKQKCGILRFKWRR